MTKVKGNFYWWTGGNITAGVLFAILGLLLADMKPVFVMAIILIPFGTFDFWWIHGSKADESESRIVTKVFAQSGLFLFTVPGSSLHLTHPMEFILFLQLHSHQEVPVPSITSKNTNIEEKDYHKMYFFKQEEE